MRRADEKDFTAWATARAAGLRGTAYLLCGDWHHAEDLVQETLTRLYVSWSKVQRRESVDAYARRVILNLFLDRRRLRSASERVSGQAEELPLRLSDRLTDPADRVSDRVSLIAALAHVPRSQRAVLVLRYWEDLSVDQVAALLGCSTGNVKSQAARGLASLRSHLAQRGVELSPVGDHLEGWTA